MKSPCGEGSARFAGTGHCVAAADNVRAHRSVVRAVIGRRRRIVQVGSMAEWKKGRLDWREAVSREAEE